MVEYIGIGVAVAGAAATAAGAVLAYRSAKKVANHEFMATEGAKPAPKANAGGTQRAETHTRAQSPRDRELKPLRRGGDPAIPAPPQRTAAPARAATAMTRTATAPAR